MAINRNVPACAISAVRTPGAMIHDLLWWTAALQAARAAVS